LELLIAFIHPYRGGNDYWYSRKGDGSGLGAGKPLLKWLDLSFGLGSHGQDGANSVSAWQTIR
jgi:hypothetical protein